MCHNQGTCKGIGKIDPEEAQGAKPLVPEDMGDNPLYLRIVSCGIRPNGTCLWCQIFREMGQEY